MPQEPGEAVNAFDAIQDDKAFMETEVKDEPGEETPGSGTTPEEKEPGEEPKEEPAKEEEKKEEPEEPRVPLSRFREVTKQVKELREQLGSREPKSPATDEDKQQEAVDRLLESKLEGILAKRESQQAQREANDAAELVELMDIYGNFDVDKVLDIKEEFQSTGTSLSNEGALKVLFERQKAGAAPSSEKPKVPQPQSSAPATPPKTADVAGKSLDQVVAEAKRDFGLKD